MNKPLISVIVSCFNQGEFLADCLNSLVEQSYTQWECIIVNDGSSDNTEEVATSWCKKDNRFQYLNKENGGSGSARNAGLNLAKGDYIQFLDSDDCLEKTKFEKSINEANKLNSKNDIILTNYKTFNHSLKKTINPGYKLSDDKFNFNAVLFGWGFEFAIPIHCGLFNANFFKTFRFPKTLRGREDWIMWITLFKENPQISFINEGLAFYRTNLNSKTKNRLTMIDNEVNAVIYLGEILDKETHKKYLTYVLKNHLETIHHLKTANNKYKKMFSPKIEGKLGDFIKRVKPNKNK